MALLFLTNLERPFSLQPLLLRTWSQNGTYSCNRFKDTADDLYCAHQLTCEIRVQSSLDSHDQAVQSLSVDAYWSEAVQRIFARMHKLEQDFPMLQAAE